MKCSVEDCENESKYAGLCGMHYKRRWRHGDPLKTETPGRGFERIQCIAEEGCDKESTYSNGLCENHYQMYRVYGRTSKIIRRGESYVDSNGYVRITVNGRMKYEHIHLAENALGRPLPEGVVVHHTQAKDDNHGYCKLVICPNQAYHILLHKRMKELGYEAD